MPHKKYFVWLGVAWRRFRSTSSQALDIISCSATQSIMKNFLLLLLTILLPALLIAQTNPNNQSLVLTHVTVIGMTGAPPKADQTLIITDNRIIAFGKRGAVSVPKNAFVVDATGKFLIPGLWDMHVHTFYEGVPELYFPLLIANGITGMRDMNGDFPIEKINQIRSMIASGKILGPRIIAAGQLIDGPRPPRALGANVVSVANVEEARRAVRLLKEQGADFIKVYNRLSAEQLSAIADECTKQKISFVGHVPLTVSAAVASETW